MNKVLDSYALLAFFEKEPGYEVVKNALAEALEKDSFLLMTTINAGEVYYIIARELGIGKAEEIWEVIKTLPVEIVEVDAELAKEAARFKARFSISYADCFVAALARMKKAEIITGDKEFENIAREVRIKWI